MVECPECSSGYQKLGCHWRYSPSHRPNLTQKQLEITTGLLMGDGTINKTSKNCYLESQMISKNYLEYLDNIFGVLGCSVKHSLTASESAKNNRNSGFRPNAKKENYSDVYRWSTRCHPKFNEFREWYSSGEKVWPENIELTPTVLKHWYVGDGYYSNKNTNNNINIAASNEFGNENKIENYFKNADLPKPSNHSIYEKENGRKDYVIEWTVEDSYKLWDYMGEPLPDFEYKWPEEYR